MCTLRSMMRKFSSWSPAATTSSLHNFCPNSNPNFPIIIWTHSPDCLDRSTGAESLLIIGCVIKLCDFVQDNGSIRIQGHSICNVEVRVSGAFQYIWVASKTLRYLLCCHSSPFNCNQAVSQNQRPDMTTRTRCKESSKPISNCYISTIISPTLTWSINRVTWMEGDENMWRVRLSPARVY